jgi:hypothetical protein
MNDWRQDAATDAQKRRLKEEGIKFSSSITKGEASDLIGSTVEPDDHEIAILKFFKIAGISKMSQTDARKKIESIFDKSENKERWENRPADKNQKEIYKFFNLTVPSNLSYKDAEEFIGELFENEEKLEAWEKHEEEMDDRESWFEDNYEMFNDDRDLYDCKKISKKLFKQVVESLESSGMTLEQIEDNEDAFFEKALEINPELHRAPVNREASSRKYSSKKKSSGGIGGIVIIVIIIIIVLAFI